MAGKEDDPIAELSGDELQRAILRELQGIHIRLARAETMAAAVMSGKSAKWLALFAKANGPGDRR